jgi:hypothetical protein
MFGLGGKKIKQERQKTRVEKRVDSLPTSELLQWAEQALYPIGRNLSSWQKSNEEVYLEEARMNAEVVYTIVETIAKRQNAKF